MATRLTIRNEQQTNEPGLAQEDPSLSGGGDVRPSSVVPAVSCSVSQQDSPQAPPIPEGEPVVGEGSVGSEEFGPLVPQQVERLAGSEDDPPGEPETRVPLQANPQGSTDPENQRTDPTTPVGGRQTLVRPDKEDPIDLPDGKLRSWWKPLVCFKTLSI